ncbi:MAG: hypothetical protein MPN21_24285 [Thermoanaerobaculia bacterium]|nr:hypothetical protein [Thermoanaerobaculia bacterium]
MVWPWYFAAHHRFRCQRRITGEIFDGFSCFRRCHFDHRGGWFWSDGFDGRVSFELHALVQVNDRADLFMS